MSPLCCVHTQVLEVAQKELMQECDYEYEAAAARQFKLNLAPHPEFAVPAVVPALSSKRVLTTEWMPGMPIDRAAADEMSVSERNRVGSRLLWLSLTGAPTHPPRKHLREFSGCVPCTA